mmetsp:Transcript_30672/g.72388  ORF Transcript_30672/g.72388 Transcript_30672/m.72388 type:complete len:84 (+) Transcript_30672:807-1058(+)
MPVLSTPCIRIPVAFSVKVVADEEPKLVPELHRCFRNKRRAPVPFIEDVFTVGNEKSAECCCESDRGVLPMIQGLLSKVMLQW